MRFHQLRVEQKAKAGQYIFSAFSIVHLIMVFFFNGGERDTVCITPYARNAWVISTLLFMDGCLATLKNPEAPLRRRRELTSSHPHVLPYAYSQKRSTPLARPAPSSSLPPLRTLRSRPRLLSYYTSLAQRRVRTAAPAATPRGLSETSPLRGPP